MGFLDEITKPFKKVQKWFAEDVLDDVLGKDVPKPVTPIAAGTPGQILPGVTQEPVELSIATTSYLETQDYLAIQRQKALVKGIAASGIISEKQAGAIAAMRPAKKPIDLKIIALVMIVFWGITRWR